VVRDLGQRTGRILRTTLRRQSFDVRTKVTGTTPRRVFRMEMKPFLPWPGWIVPTRGL
jgi:hypothetical protein